MFPTTLYYERQSKIANAPSAYLVKTVPEQCCSDDSYFLHHAGVLGGTMPLAPVLMMVPRLDPNPPKVSQQTCKENPP